MPDARTFVSSTANVPASIARAAATADHRFTTTLPDGGEHVRATFVPLTNAGKPVATIAVWSDVEVIGTIDRKLGLAFAIAIPLFGILATIVGSAIAGRGLAPLEQIVSDASAIEAHDLNARVRLPATRELHRLGTTLNRMLERLNEAFDRERRFTSDASHELRAPLSIILAETDLALGAERSPAEYRRALETIALETDALEALTRNLLATARAKAVEPASAEPVDLAEVAASVTARARILADARGVRIRASLAPDAVVMGEADDIEQAVLTIVHNAIKHASPKGSIALDLEVRADRVDLRIADDGPGFSADALVHAFDRFWHENTGDTAATGHGLGLAIARAIVERYLGTITLANRRTGGGVVTICLPTAPPIRSRSSDAGGVRP
jgi:signal transduction histidine kinase